MDSDSKAGHKHDVPEFFAKPSCVTNGKQRQVLRRAGVEFIEHDLLTYPWTETRLANFFAGLDKVQWLNPSAPQLKQGQIDPETLTEQQLLTLMVQEPVLIRRPLIRWQGQHWVGFNWPELCKVLPVTNTDAVALEVDEQCSVSAQQ